MAAEHGGQGAERGFFARLHQALGDPRLRVIATLRADFEHRVARTVIGDALKRGRESLDVMGRDALREVIRGPAAQTVIYFEPDTMAEALVDEVWGMPGGLPLLSFTLSELYQRSFGPHGRGQEDRTLRRDASAQGLLTDMMEQRAEALFATLPDDPSAIGEAPCQATIRRLMLRLISLAGGDLCKRRATRDELIWRDPDETARMGRVVEAFVQARLLVAVDATPPGLAAIEPAHDILVTSWARVRRWRNEVRDQLPLRQALWRAAREWRSSGEHISRLWHDDPRLPQAESDAVRADLNAIERDFIERSRQHRTRRRRRLVTALLVVIAVLTLATLDALTEARRADRQAARAEARKAEAERQTEVAREQLHVAVA
ncbi:MAG: hypothetical protein KC620_13805, partial [Myxococcales bacterium]|nr:hypothetical protein [Myxococcales bacterium]